ncbi:hypothetical protein YC2023_010956 [Brassica napus]
MQQENLGSCLAARLDIGSVRGSYLNNYKELSNETNCNGNLTHQGLTSNWNHVQSFSGERVMGSTSQVILCVIYLNFSKFIKSQSYLWRPGEYARPCADYKEAWKQSRRKNKHEEDNRFKPPDLNKNQHVPGFILIKEAPPDAAYNPKLSKNRFGIRLLLFDKFSFANLLCFNEFELGFRYASGVWRTQQISPFSITEPISNNAYQRGLQGEYNLILNFKVNDLVPLTAGKTDLRTNLFQEGGNDMILDQLTNKENVIMDQLVDEDAPAIPEGPNTCSRSKKLNEADGGILKISRKQEDCLGCSLINQDTLTTIQATPPSS